MRYPLITPLASRDGTVDKDEHLVNCFGEHDDETKETRVIKRAGIDEGDAVISGNDIYGQGAFNYDGYLFSVINDVLVQWIYVGGLTPGDSGITYLAYGQSVWDAGIAYDINDKVFYDGTLYYSGITQLGDTPDQASPHWRTAPIYLGDPPLAVVWGGCIIGGTCSGGPVYKLSDGIAWVNDVPTNRYLIYLGPNVDYYGEAM